MPKTRTEESVGDWVPAWLLTRGGGIILVVASISCLGGAGLTVGLAASNPLDGRAASAAELVPLLAGNCFGLAWSLVCVVYLWAERLGEWFSPSVRRPVRDR